MRLLLIAFYFPPAGGGGVQRPLKLMQHLASFGIEPHVLAPSDPKWIHRDEGLEIPHGLKVHRAPYLGARGRLPAEELYGLRGLERFLRRAELAPRRLLVPDEHVAWFATAVPAARRIIRSEGIDAVMTTSPPSSINLVGALVAASAGVPWIADLRDSVVAKPDRRFDRAAVRAKERVHRQVAVLVARRADGIVAVTETIAGELRTLGARGEVVVVANGADFEDFEGLEYRRHDRFRITHTGSFFGRRDPRPLLEALRRSPPDVVARFAGDFRARDRSFARELGVLDRLELQSFRSHRDALALQRDSEANLLLLHEEGGRGLDVPSGKVFEYLAARRPILAAVPTRGAAAALIREAGAGIVVPPDDVDGLVAAIGALRARWQADDLPDVDLEPPFVTKIARFERARELSELIHRVARGAAGRAASVS